MIPAKALIASAVTRIPVLSNVYERLRTGGETNSARYCYSVWMRHLVLGHKCGLFQKEIKSVAELGPGDSIGMGIAALLTGAERYYGLDVFPFTAIDRNLIVLEELAALIGEPIPDHDEFPNIRPRLASYDFPRGLVTPPERSRIEQIRASIRSPNTSMVRYAAPWTDVWPEPVDLIFSQAVLEHVEPLDQAYRMMWKWLSPGGCISHQIDLKCHGTAKEWNGHWTHGEKTWRFLRGNRAYFLNRAAKSEHLRLIKEAGFEIVNETAFTAATIDRKRLAPEFANLSDEDLETCGLFVQARKAHTNR